MRRFFAALLIASPLSAQKPKPAAQSSAQPAAQGVPELPQQSEIINLSLLDALVAIDRKELAGVFGFIAEQNAPPALADYLLRDGASFKRYVKKGERDLKDAGGVNEWDQIVLRYALTIYGSGTLEKDSVPKSYVDRAQKLAVAPALPLQAITLRRKG